MKSTWLKQISNAVATLAALTLATAACAQYVWLNENGVKQYSDMPPPSSVPNNRILKQPARASDSVPQATATPAVTGTEGARVPTGTDSPSASNKEKAPMTTAEKNADFRKRKIEQEEKEKKAADEAKRAADKAKNCDRARTYQRALDSGQRIGDTDKDGERYYLSDEQREQEVQATRNVLNDCK
jgi:hypothetical protein